MRAEYERLLGSKVHFDSAAFCPRWDIGILRGGNDLRPVPVDEPTERPLRLAAGVDRGDVAGGGAVDRGRNRAAPSTRAARAMWGAVEALEAAGSVERVGKAGVEGDGGDVFAPGESPRCFLHGELGHVRIRRKAGLGPKEGARVEAGDLDNRLQGERAPEVGVDMVTEPAVSRRARRQGRRSFRFRTAPRAGP